MGISARAYDRDRGGRQRAWGRCSNLGADRFRERTTSWKEQKMKVGQKAVECIIPILNVGNIATSLEFYVDVLGFKRDWLYQKRLVRHGRRFAR